MTSLPTSFPTGSFSSPQNVMDAIASYRRSQYFAAGSRVTVVSDTETFSDDEEESSRDSDEEGSRDSENVSTSVAQDDLDQYGWEAECDDRERLAPPPLPFVNTENREREGRRARETTPLLGKAITFTAAPHPRRQSSVVSVGQTPPNNSPQLAADPLHRPPPSHRRSSASSSRSGKYNYGGKSTFGQTLFNSIAILLGIGMLSEPLAFAYSGWFAGTLLIVSYGAISCYTAKILARIILADPRLRSYADVGRKAFGPSATLFISTMFCLELFAVSVILVTLYADSLHTLIPDHSTTTYKLWGLVLLVPTVFLPLSLLSYTSVFGIISSVLIIFVVLWDGFSKSEAPGSFWYPAETDLGIKSWNNLGLAFGLFMAGFSGHAVIPSLARDMADPTQFNRMIHWAFIVATFLYALIGYAGYLMFGRHVSEEISMNLLQTSGYNPVLNKIAIWMLVISPLSKFALTTQPLNATIEILFGIDGPLAGPEDMALKSNGLTIAPRGSRTLLKRILAVTQRVLITALSVLVSILVPDFGSTMAFLGSFSAFMLCIIGPISAKIALAGRCNALDAMILALGGIMAIWGTVSAFLVS